MTKILIQERTIFSHPIFLAHTILLVVPMALLVVFALARLDVYYVLISFAGGWLIWTFMEYIFNRWLFHASERTLSLVMIITRHHKRHHAEPQNLRYIFPHPLTILIAPVTLLLLAAWLIGRSSLSLTSGFLSG